MGLSQNFHFHGGTVYDGSGDAGKAATVVVSGDKIKAILPPDTPVNNNSIPVDISNLVLAPGFIDIHAHGDLEQLAVREADSKLVNGVTTEVCGNCGSTPFPIIQHYPGYLREKAEKLGVEVCWHNAGDYFLSLEKAGSAINRLFLLGHGRLRAAVLGAERRPATFAERRQMAQLVVKSMEQGCWGLSSGLMYAPGCHAELEELIELCKVVARYDGYYATHLRSEGDGLLAAIAETFKVAEQSGVKVQISHLKISGKPNWQNIDELKKLLTSAPEAGIRLGADWYPYEAWNANLDSLLPGWVYEGGTARLLERLRDPAVRSRLAGYVAKASEQGLDWDKIMIGTVTLPEHKHFCGQNIMQIAKNLALAPEDVFFNLILAEGGRAEGIFNSMSLAVQKEIFSWSFVSVGSDSTARSFTGPTARGHHHPRTYGTCSRVLKRVREEKLLPLRLAIRRMTSLPAAQIGLTDRGMIKPGAVADLVVFDPQTVKDTATFEEPVQKPEGVIHVVVNGVFALRNRKITGSAPGKLLRKNNVVV